MRPSLSTTPPSTVPAVPAPVSCAIAISRSVGAYSPRPCTHCPSHTQKRHSMSDGDEQRRLAAIMFTDMVGYSALAQRNEALALALVGAQQRLLRPIVAQHGGREVKGTGDGFLVEFSSALHAASCAIDMQKVLA